VQWLWRLLPGAAVPVGGGVVGAAIGGLQCFALGKRQHALPLRGGDHAARCVACVPAARVAMDGRTAIAHATLAGAALDCCGYGLRQQLAAPSPFALGRG
jgi:hypothetical protein